MKLLLKWVSVIVASTISVSMANAQSNFKIGEVNSYKAQPAFLEPYKKGMELAVEEINSAGGVNGRKIELISRDDNANPGDAVSCLLYTSDAADE